ncbi:MAG: hypothetical protein R2795_02370 [Saprospiraceae bacterium]
MRGNYTLFTLEKRPAFTGLAIPYAMDLIPGTWVSGIQIGKGGSLESGAGALSGQINTELQQPTTDVPVFLNLLAIQGGVPRAICTSIPNWAKACMEVPTCTTA